MYHQIVLVGHAGRDPEMHYTPNGTPVTNFSVATSRKYSGSDGQVKEETIWFRITVWGKQAETVNQYVTKGMTVLVEGQLVADENGAPKIWSGSDGKPRASFEIRANTVRFLSRVQKEAEGESPKSVDDDDSLPF